MTERDSFESQFLPAYRRYLDEAPTANAVTMARAAVLAGQRRAWNLWPTTFPATRSLAWVALLALLLLALVAAAVFVGSQRPALSYVCPAGSHPDVAGPASQERPPAQYVQPMAFDQRAGRIVAVTTDYEVYDTWTFDVCANVWTKMDARVSPGTWTSSSSMAYDPRSDRTIIITGERVWTYDLAADAWTRKSLAPKALTYFGRLTYDSRMGRVIGLAADNPTSTPESLELWSYDVASDAWTHIEQTGLPPLHQRPIVAYESSMDRLIVYDGELRETWVVDAGSGEWTQSPNWAPPLPYDWAVSGGEIAYDERADLIVAYSNGTLLTYDASADIWQVLAERDGATTAPQIGRPTLVYDSVNRRIVVLGSEEITKNGQWHAGSDVVAFDVATREWTTLLERK